MKNRNLPSSASRITTPLGYKKFGGWIEFFAAINRNAVNNYNAVIGAEDQRKYLAEFSFSNASGIWTPKFTRMIYWCWGVWECTDKGVLTTKLLHLLKDLLSQLLWGIAILHELRSSASSLRLRLCRIQKSETVPLQNLLKDAILLPVPCQASFCAL